MRWHAVKRSASSLMPSVNTLRPSKTLDVATRSYQAGAGDYLTVLTAQRSLWSAQESLISLQQTDLENRITLWQSLGVGLSNACGAIRTRGEEKIHTFGWRRYTECNDIFLGKHVSLNGGFDEICTRFVCWSACCSPRLPMLRKRTTRRGRLKLSSRYSKM